MTDTDRELLELAAIAAGHPIDDGHIEETTRGIYWSYIDGNADTHPPPNDSAWSEIWNPLTDDGDALRLAVKLRLAMYPPESKDEDGATVSTPGEDGFWHVEDPTGDAYADMRRAIVRAAAEIGRNL